jgi:4-hydroxy-tetrahydrodipicolinate synthase
LQETLVMPSRNSIADLTGYASALPTPFRAGGIDDAAFETLCAWQIAEGVSGLVVCGTTGEAPTLSSAEQHHLIRRAVEIAQGRVPVIAGAGSNATPHAIDLARGAEQAGADALLVVVPYYNRPPQEGLYRHFRAIHDAVDLPILLYDVPSRTGCRLADETVVRLARLTRIVGLKDATGDLARPARLRALVGPEFRLLSGDDASALGFLARGGDGCISVISNVAPGLCVDLHAAWAAGDFCRAEALSLSIAKLSRALFLESNPVPLKYALGLMGLMSAAVRLPLCEAGEATRREVAACLHDPAVACMPVMPRWRALKPTLAPVA